MRIARLLPAVFTAALATAAGLNEKVFLKQCQDVTLSGVGRPGQTSLVGQCHDRAGNWWLTVLNLNECLGADDYGRLVYQES
ncbi:Cyanovirin-N [Purpureocillium lavendulum]|uniref:Cyanovirin-N n=1 Tax=Purpureocillium lavendulum TaxID=1247861 RepID=A0AB34G091_9HYPO|nr:Cyanovirin-N [Purpureocillium lavendulum]